MNDKYLGWLLHIGGGLLVILMLLSIQLMAPDFLLDDVPFDGQG